MNVYEKLLSVQSKLKAPKNQYNAFGKYNYRNCEDILEALKPLCKEVNAVVYITDKIIMLGERYYIEATAHFIDAENDNSQVTVTAYAREEETKKGMDGSQVTGASSSYARKYALNGLFDIDDTKDSDTTNNGDNGAKNAPPKPQPEQPTDYRALLIGELKRRGIDTAAYAAEHKMNKSTTPEEFKRLYEALTGADEVA